MSVISVSTQHPTSGHTTSRLETHRRLLKTGTELFAEGRLRDEIIDTLLELDPRRVRDGSMNRV
jgi:hypothetical protein